jgi:hypothetical protein
MPLQQLNGLKLLKGYISHIKLLDVKEISLNLGASSTIILSSMNVGHASREWK